jgi:hypothetical protein
MPFRAAFAIDNDYQPARANLSSLGAAQYAPAVSQEIGPNGNYLVAHIATFNKP